MKTEQIHFSIDDVILSLKWLKDNNPKSIFEMDFFKTLRLWNKKYGLQTSLYIYEMCNGFSIEELPQQYWDEFRENTSWLKFCWHRRKAGPLEDDYNTEIESFNRVKNIICNNISADAWTDTVRLHRYEASNELIKYLNEYGDINCLLCTDEDRLCYDLDIKETNYLINIGMISKRGMMYQKTDIRLDYFDVEENATVDSLLIKTKDILNISSDNTLVLFCNEWRFDLICDYIDQYFQGLLKTMLYLNSAVVINEYIYFTTCNENALFRTDFNGNIDFITYLPVNQSNSIKFQSLQYINGMIWMIPWGTSSIFIYDLSFKKLYKLQLPYGMTQNNDREGFRSCIQIGKELWLLPNRYKAIIKINTEDVTYETFKIPKEFEFQDKSNRNFTMMCNDGNYLFLFGDGCAKDIKFNYISKTYEIWNNKSSTSFGVVANKKLYISPKREKDKVLVYDILSGNLLEEDTLPETVWLPSNYYSYWFAIHYDQQVFMMPTEANGIIIKDIFNGEYKIISVDTKDYKTLRDDKYYSVYQILKEKQGSYIFISHKGNKITFINSDGKILKDIILEVEINNNYNGHPIYGNIFGNNIINEKPYYLNEFLKLTKTCNVIDWKQTHSHVKYGVKIHTATKNHH